MNRKRLAVLILCLAVLVPASPAVLSAPDFELPSAGLNYDQYPALREVYKDYCLIGTIDRFDRDSRTEFMGYTYNAVTHENNMKPSSVQATKGIFWFDTARASIAAAQAGIEGVNMIGHTLTWHSQSPNWLWDAPDFDRETALSNLHDHIDAVMGEFGGILQAMDVVNEAIGVIDPADPRNWKFALEKGEGWVLALGWEWVELAFLRAAKVVDENGWDCKLYYNDFSLDSGAKARVVYEMVRDINRRYEGHRPNGKPLIEGIGMQGHYNSSTKMSNVEASVELFSTLPGVAVSFTELDIEYLNTGTLTPEQAVSQAQQYALLFQIVRKYAAGPANTSGYPKVIERVTFWGTDDGASWKSSSLPLLFNAPANGQITGKEALLGALWPDEYLEKYPYIEEEDTGEGYTVPGVHLWLLSKGDTWSGANIILGSSADEWPWSTAWSPEDEDDKTVAFIPEKDETYRLSVNYTAMGTAGIRVRWVKDNTNGNYTAMDGQVVLTPPYSDNLRPGDAASTVPAHFNRGMVNAGTYTLVTNVRMDGAEEAEGLIGNLAIRGSLGGNSFDINWIKMEKVSTGEIMFVWDPLNPYVPEPDPEPDPSPEPEASPARQDPIPGETPPPDPTQPEGGKSKTGGIILSGLGVLTVLAPVVFLIKRKK
jgi:endo-1,4-beta-xylanase